VIQMKDATNRAVGVADAEGNIIASSELSLVGSQLSGNIYAVADAVGDRIAVAEGRTFKMLGTAENHSDSVVFVDGTDDTARSLCLMACIALSEAKAHYEEKYDKSALIKNILIDNILPGDIYVSAKELHLNAEASRAVFLIRQTERPNITALDVLQRLFQDKQRDFVISISETDIVVVKEVPEGADGADLRKIALSIEQTLKSELALKTVIGIGTLAHHLRELADRYKEAQVAIDIVKVFEDEKEIINYENLGIARLIYQLPTTLCEMFLSEVFKKNPIDSLDQETLNIINKFFENNLNISETSRKLFVHRNTLVYRLGKIKKLTGLDLREFDQAIVFKVALMVKKYLNSQQQKA